MHRRNVASAPISSIKEEEDVPTSTPITMRPPKKPRSWLNLETVRLAVPVLAGGRIRAKQSRLVKLAESRDKALVCTCSGGVGAGPGAAALLSPLSGAR